MRQQTAAARSSAASRAAALNSFLSLVKELKAFLVKMDLRRIMQAHAVSSMVLGLGTVGLPHTFLSHAGGTDYSHYAHEFIRLYGCLTLAIGWIVWKSQTIKDGRLARSLSEVFAVSYVLQGIVMLRAQFTNPAGHTWLHWQVALVFLFIGFGYGFIRWVKKIKLFALPGANED
jgi:hypothetical protein